MTSPPFKVPALDVFAQLRRGRMKHDLTERLHEVVQGVTNTGKKGKLVIELTIEPLKNDKTQVDVTDVITTKVPTLSLPSSRFFVTDDANLTRDDPQQERLGGIAAVPVPDKQRKAN